MPEDIFLNVYDYNSLNKITNFLGLGFFHLGIEIYGTEYSFNKDGIFSLNPKNNTDFLYRETIYLGKTTQSYYDFFNNLTKLKIDFNNQNYDLLNRNSIHFCSVLANNLDVSIPNRFSRINNLIPNFIKNNNQSNLEVSKIE